MMISSSTQTFVKAMLAGLSRYHVVGTFIGGEPDHSFLYSVLARAGIAFPFISASCLAVRTAAHAIIFPTVYNEDWFSIFPCLVHDKVATVGSAKQLVASRESKLTKERVASEELGDLLAEGLMTALHKARARVWIGYCRLFLKSRSPRKC